jgi:hypothetical protein
MKNLEKSNELILNALRQQLESAGIDLSEWGEGQTKTLTHLQREIENGETVLITSEKGELLRRVVVSSADIFYFSPAGKKYRLKEDKQVFKDGRERKRDLKQAVSEKVKLNEDPKNTIIRGMREELGIEGEISLTETGIDEQLLSSFSYPGLQSQYIRHKFETILTDQQFKFDGYIEKQEDKSTYFVWEEVK